MRLSSRREPTPCSSFPKSTILFVYYWASWSFQVTETKIIGNNVDLFSSFWKWASWSGLPLSSNVSLAAVTIIIKPRLKYERNGTSHSTDMTTWVRPTQNTQNSQKITQTNHVQNKVRKGLEYNQILFLVILLI